MIYAEAQILEAQILAMLQYAHQNGCPWEDGTTSLAQGEGYKDMVKYASESGLS